MKHSLYYKFILGYLVFGILGFFVIATTASEMTYNQLISQEAETLYDEARLLASRYSQVYKGRNININSAYPQLEAVATYLKAEVWVVNNRGTIVVDSNHSARAGEVIADFDPVFSGNRPYAVGNYNDCFTEEVMSVLAPITGNYMTYGYVLIHLPMRHVQTARDGFLNLLYIISGIIFALSLIILLVFTKTVYFPLKKITEAANQYAEGNQIGRAHV